MTYPKILAGQTVTAALLNAGRREYVTNSAGSQSTTLTTFVDVTGLTFTGEANARYYVHALVAYDAPVDSANGDVNFQWTGPVDAGMSRHIVAPELAATTNIDTNVMSVRRAIGTDVRVGGTAGTANAFSIYEDMIDLTMITAGAITLQFAVGAGVATATIQADSFVYYQRVA
jgi:hypothetical protein